MREVMKPGIFFAAVLLVTVFLFGAVSCTDSDDQKYIDREQRLLEQYLIDNNIDEEPTESGLYYIEMEEGDGVSPAMGNYLIIEYRVRLITGKIVETTYEQEAKDNDLYNPDIVYGPYKFRIDNTPLEGVKEGLLMMKEGGRARLIIPSHLAYGSSSVGEIPKYSTLIFDIKLHTVIDDPERHERQLITQYVEDNNIVEDPTDFDIYYIEIEEGTGDHPDIHMNVVVHYTGWFIDGRMYNTTKDTQPFEFVLGEHAATPGFEAGIKMMKPGGKAKLIVPSWRGYGPDGTADGRIPPWMTIIYEVELLELY